MKKINNILLILSILFGIAGVVFIMLFVTKTVSGTSYMYIDTPQLRYLTLFLRLSVASCSAVFAIFKKHKSYWILFTYELLVSLLILNDILGTSVFTYFYLPDIWQLLNTFTITPEIFGLPGFLQPIIIFVGVSFLALIAKFAYQQKSGEKK